MKKTISYVALALLLGGCAITPHELSVSSETSVALSRIKQETAIALSFTDERDSTNLGKRVGGFGAKITATDLMANIKVAVRSIFIRKGYRLVATNASYDASVQVAVRSFRYDVTSGFWTHGEHVSAVFIIEGKKQGKTLKKIYRSDTERRILYESFGSEIDEKMSDALRNVLTQIAQDSELEQFLVSGS